MSALLKFGLLEDTGSKNARQARLTELALKILLSPPDSKEHLEAIQEAALKPPIHADLWEKYGKELPSPINLKLQLVRQGFMDNAAGDFVQQYQETLAFAKLLGSDNISGSPVDKPLLEKEVEMTPPPVVENPKLNGQERTETFRWRLSRNAVADVKITGTKITPHDLEMLCKHLDLSKQAFDDDVSAQPTQPTVEHG